MLSLRRLVANRPAAWLWLAQFISVIGDSLFMPCLAWLASGGGKGGLPVGIAVFIATVPHLLFGPLAGTLADRVDRRRLMIGSDLVRAGLLFLLPVAVLMGGGLPFALLVGVAFLLTACAAPFLAARDALLPALVEGEELPRWNAFIQTSAHLALVVGLGLGAALLTELERRGVGRSDTDRVVGVLAFDGLTFLLSAWALARIRIGARARPRREGRTTAWSDVRSGLSYARRDPLVRGLLVLTALNNLAIMGPAIVGAVLLVRHVFEGGAGALALFEGAMAVGMLAGLLLLARCARRRWMGRTLLWGMVLDGLTYVPFLWIADFGLALVMITLHGFFIPWIVVSRTSLVQTYVPDGQRGRVFALVNLTVYGMTALSALACGWLADLWSVRVLFGVAGVFGTLSGFFGMLCLGARLDAVGAPRATTSA